MNFILYKQLQLLARWVLSVLG